MVHLLRDEFRQLREGSKEAWRTSQVLLEYSPVTCGGCEDPYFQEGASRINMMPNMDESYLKAFDQHRAWMRAFDAPKAIEERARVVTKVLTGGRELKGVAEYEILELHRLTFMLKAITEGWTQYGFVPEDNDSKFAKDWKADIESGIAHYLSKILTSPKATSSLKRLAEVVKAFPLTSPPPLFAAHYHAPRGFEPDIQDGLKAVMLCEFWRQRKKMRGRHAGLELPTIGELDRAIRETWKWHGDDKELRDARRELGLNGLPRSKGGRPKKQRGKT